jgi:hypothetical protein
MIDLRMNPPQTPREYDESQGIGVFRLASLSCFHA